MRTIFAAVLFVGIAAAQTFTLGTAADPCTGGAVWPNPPDTLASPIPTLRFGAQPFSCTFAAAGGGGAYTVEIDFVEPAAFVPASDPDGRLFSVSVTDAWASQVYGQINNIDLFTRGAISAAVVIPVRMLAVTGDGKIMVSLSTVKRSAVISRVTITPYAPAPDLSGYVSKADLDLAGYISRSQLPSLLPPAPDLAPYLTREDAANGYVPYLGAQADVDIGSHAIKAGSLTTNTGGPSRVYLTQGPCPTALPTGFDFALCIDTDGRAYKVSAAGVKTPIAQ